MDKEKPIKYKNTKENHLIVEEHSESWALYFIPFKMTNMAFAHIYSDTKMLFII